MYIDKLERRVSQNSSDGGGDNEADFFDHDIHKVTTMNEVPVQKNNLANGALSKLEVDDGEEPSVEAALTMSPTQAQEKLGTRKPTIGQRKPAKKGGVSNYTAQPFLRKSRYTAAIYVFHKLNFPEFLQFS